MGKNRKKKKDEFLDVSYRKKIDIDTNQEYTDEELKILIVELNKQIEQLNALHRELYSSNACIERIFNRTFTDILREKMASIVNDINTFRNKYRIERKN